MHAKLRNLFGWYDNWHNHPRHQHTHWMLFLVLSILTTSLVSHRIGDFYHENEYKANAQTVLNLGLNGDKFTVNGATQFLLFISYFDAMAAPDSILDSDFAALRSRGFNGIRIFANWNPTDNPSQLMDGDGNLKPGRIEALKNILQKADNNGLIVDISFTPDTVSGMTIPEFINGLRSTTQELIPFRNLYYDITNEANHAGVTCGNIRLCASEARQARDAIKAIDSQRIVSVSLNSDSIDPSYTVNGGMDFTLVHGPGGRLDITRNLVMQARSIIPSLAIHLQEPDRCRDSNCQGYTSNSFITAAGDAKCAGATGWTFHTQGGYNLSGNTMFNQWIDPNVENSVADGLASAIASVVVGSCTTTTGPTPTPGGGGNPPFGPFQGACPNGFISIAGANASAADPTETAGWFADDDIGIPPEVTGMTFPMNGLLVCSGNSSGTAFLGDPSIWPSNAGRPGNPGWEFINGRPFKNGSPVVFIAEASCTSSSVPITVTSANIDAGAFTNNPATAGDVCVPGTLVTPAPPVSTITITSISPNSAPEGASVTITGTNLDQCEPLQLGGGVPSPLCNVTFTDKFGNRSTISGLTTSPTTVTATAGSGLCGGTGTVQVSLPGTPSNTLPFTFTNATATGTACGLAARYIFYLYPVIAPAGAPIRLAGENLSGTVHFFNAGGTETITTGTISAFLTSPNAFVDLNVPATLAPGSYTIKVGESATDLSNGVAFTVAAGPFVPSPTLTDPPIITSFSPTTIGQGGTLEIFGSNLPITVQLTDDVGQATTLLGWANSGNSVVTVGIPSNIAPGQYTVSVTGSNGSTTATDKLSVTEGTPAINAAAVDVVIPESETTFGALIGGALTYAVYALGIAVFVMFLYAGFLWITSAANPGNIAVAKKYMTNAVIGAVLLLSSYIILYTINPDLVGGDLKLEPIIPPPPSTTIVVPPGGNASQVAAKNLISTIGMGGFSSIARCSGFNASQNIQDVAAGNLPAVCSPTCSCVAGGASGNININPIILNGLIALWNSGVRFTVTSFTTGVHAAGSDHYLGNAVDISINSTNVNDWTSAVDFLIRNTGGGNKFCETTTGLSDTDCSPLGGSGVDHIHWDL